MKKIVPAIGIILFLCWGVGNYGQEESSLSKIIAESNDQEFLLKQAKKNPDPSLRILALKRVINEDSLVAIAKSDPVEIVRRNALECIRSNDALLECLRANERDVSYGALERISDKSLLENIFLDKYYWNDVRAQILKQIKVTIPQRILEDVLYKVLNGAVGKIELLSRIFDLEIAENILYKIAKDKEINIEIRMAAIAHLTDKVQLMNFAEKDKEKLIQKVAKLGLMGEADLVKIALEEPDAYVRNFAIKRIENQAILEDIAKNSRDDGARLEASKKLINEDQLKELAVQDQSLFVRVEVLHKIQDQDFLANAAKTDANWRIRRAAIENIKNMDLLLTIAMEDKDWAVAARAIETLDENRLEAFVNSSNDFSLIQLAAGKIKNQALLEKIARSGSRPYVRIAAIGNLFDHKLAEEIARQDADPQVLEKVKNLPVTVFGLVADKKGFPVYGIGLQIISANGEEVIFNELNDPDYVMPRTLDTRSNHRGEFAIKIPAHVLGFIKNRFRKQIYKTTCCPST